LFSEGRYLLVKEIPVSAHDEALRRIAKARATNAKILDVGGLILDSLPKELGQLPALRVLALGQAVLEYGNLKWVWVGSRPLQRFMDVNVLASLTGLEALGLSHCEALENVDGLKKLTELRTLDLSHCYALTNVDGLKELTGLKRLDLTYCKALENVDVLKKLTALRTLNLSCCVALKNVDTLKELTGLKSLDLTYCKSLENVDGLKKLTGLRTLHLSPREGLTNVDVLKKLTRLERLDLSYCKALQNVDGLKELTGLRTLDLTSCESLGDVDVLKGLTGLETLKLSHCYVLKNVDGLKELTGLKTLKLSHCYALENVDGLKELTGLRTLDLCHCKALANVEVLKELNGLRRLNLSGCSSLRLFEPLSHLLPTLISLCLYQCRFDDLKAHFCGESRDDNVLADVRAHYFEGDLHGWQRDDELKVFILGNGGVGKTQLCRRLRGFRYRPQPTTPGVQLKHINISIPGRDQQVRFNLWDFGGQDIYHGTHRLFLHEQSVFVILWTPDTEVGEYEEAGVKMFHRSLAYWLDYVRSVAGNESPILIVQGKCDTPPGREPFTCSPPRGFRLRAPPGVQR
jgi:internalin A